jgi:uncharacterized protein (UPF0333 family)
MVRKRSKAQISMEYMIVFGIAFTLTLPLLIIYAKQTENVQADVTNAQVYKAANKMGDYADEVYFSGKPSQRTVTITFPKGITQVTSEGTLLLFNVSTAELDYVLTKETNTNLSVNIGSYEGPHVLVFKAEQDYVSITEK